MPQASDELHDAWEAIFDREFPSGIQVPISDTPGEVVEFTYIDTIGPETFLKKRGWTITKEWNFEPPAPILLGDIERDEWIAISFLRNEWDYGTILNLIPTT